MELNFEITSDEFKDLKSYCDLNNLKIDDIIKKCYLSGYRIEKYGLLGGNGEVIEKIVEKEVVKYVEVPKVVEKIEYVEVPKEVEKIIEIIKEVPGPTVEVKVIEYVDREVVREVIKEIPVTNFDNFGDKSKLEAIQNTLQKLRQECLEKDKIISEYKKTIEEIEKFQDNKKAFFMRGSNMDDALYNKNL